MGTKKQIYRMDRRDLSEKGVQEAVTAGQQLKKDGFEF
jgi:bisphosphoglycerate-dependent phosphoglycerate mutase